MVCGTAHEWCHYFLWHQIQTHGNTFKFKSGNRIARTMSDSRKSIDLIDASKCSGNDDVDIPIVSLSELLEENADMFTASNDENKPARVQPSTSDGTAHKTATGSRLHESDDEIEIIGEVSNAGSSARNIETTANVSPPDDAKQNSKDDEKTHQPKSSGDNVKNNGTVISANTNPSGKSLESDVVILLDDDDDEVEKMDVDAGQVDADKNTNVSDVPAANITQTATDIAGIELLTETVSENHDKKLPDTSVKDQSDVDGQPGSSVLGVDDVHMLEPTREKGWFHSLCFFFLMVFIDF